MRRLIGCACAAFIGLGGMACLVRADDSAAPAPQHEKKTVEGELIDTNCYSSHGATGEKHQACGKKCLASGIPAAVLVDGKAWTLSTNPVPLADAADKTVRVTGILNEQTMTILPDKVELKDGDNYTEIPLSDAHHGDKAEK